MILRWRIVRVVKKIYEGNNDGRLVYFYVFNVLDG